jgi:nucleoside-diphosphate-sugar epimerase
MSNSSTVVTSADRPFPPDPDARRPLVVVTGGSGMLGSALIKRLLPRYDLVSLDLDGDPTSPSRVEFICTDLTDTASVERAFERIRKIGGTHIASVVHLAAFYDFAGRDSPLYEEVTVEGTRRVLDALGPFDVDQFVFSSTMLVHEPHEPGGDKIDESDPIDPSWPYPRSKVETETVLADHSQSEQMSTVVLRLAGVYDEDGHSPPITNQIKRIHGNWPTSHFYPADLNRGQAFIHRDDAVAALERIVDRRDHLPQRLPVIVGEPTTIGYGELQNAIACELHGHEWTTLRIPAPLAKAGAWIREKNPFADDPFIRSWMVERASDHYELDVDTARSCLDWEPDHDLLGTVPEMIRRLRDDPARWYAANDLEQPRKILTR